MEPSEIEVDVDAFVPQFFSIWPPPEEKSNQILIDNASNEHELFRLIGSILTHGITFLYGPQIRADQMSVEQIQTVQKYMLALGVQVHIDKTANDLRNVRGILPYFLKLPTSNGQRFVFVAFQIV